MFNGRKFILLLSLLSSVLVSGSLFADAIVRSQAASASTIAEFYVDETGVRVELEVGLSDLSGFRNLLPNGYWEQAGYAVERPARERTAEFFERNLVLMTDSGKTLPGYVVSFVSGERQQRDQLTGMVLDSDAVPESVYLIELFYPFSGLAKPDALSIEGRFPSPAPTAGYVVYHQGVAVNDFRYLTASQTLDLDWVDPWYSAFRSRNLRRSYFAPMSGFLYVEPYEVRKEVIVRPKDIQRWLDLGLEGATTIPVETQAKIKTDVAEFLRTRQPVLIDGKKIEPELARVNFLSRTLRSSQVIDPPRELDINSAVMGIIFVYPLTQPLPQNVDMTWDMFDEKVQQVPVSAVDEAGPFPQFLDPDFAVLHWENFLKNPTLPGYSELPAPAASAAVTLYDWRWLVLGFLACLAVVLLVYKPAGTPAMALVVIVAAVSVWWMSQRAVMSQDEQEVLVAELLHNVYRSFDFRAESDIYDALDRSVSGELLARVYLETRNSLVLASQGGARAKVKQIELAELDALSYTGDVLFAEVTWTVNASVGHWGHMHQRNNRYKALLEVAVIDGVWKLSDAEILAEERLQ